MPGTALKTWLRGLRRRWRVERRLRRAAAAADAFLVSYPKSGRTWLRFLLSCYFAETGRVGFVPDLATTFRVLPNFDRDRVRGVGAYIGRRSGVPLILVSHLGFNRRLFRDRPVIFLVRDPRDVIVSAYFHATRHKHVFEGTIADFLDDHRYGLPAMARFLNGWAEGLRDRRHLVLSYEAMLEDPEAAASDVLDFVGVPVEREPLRRAVAHASFDRMRSDERARGIPGHDYDRNDEQSLRMRSGRAKAFAEHLEPALAKRIIDRLRADLTPAALSLLARTDLDKDFADDPSFKMATA